MDHPNSKSIWNSSPHYLTQSKTDRQTMFPTWIVTEEFEARLLSRAADEPAAYWNLAWLFPIWLFPWRSIDEPLSGIGTKTLKKIQLFWELKHWKHVHFVENYWELSLICIAKWTQISRDLDHSVWSCYIHLAGVKARSNSINIMSVLYLYRQLFIEIQRGNTVCYLLAYCRQTRLHLKG